MKPGKYIILQSNTDQIIGGFEIINNEVHNLMGMAKETITDGPITAKTTHELQRLHNGYMHVEFLEDSDPRHENRFIVVIDKKNNSKKIYDMHQDTDKKDLYRKYKTLSPAIIQAHLGSDFYIKGFERLGDIKREFQDMKHKHTMSYVKKWAEHNGHHSPRFLYNLLKGL